MRHLKGKNNFFFLKWISSARMEMSMIPAEKETPVKKRAAVLVLLISTKLMSLGEIMRIYVNISILSSQHTWHADFNPRSSRMHSQRYLGCGKGFSFFSRPSGKSRWEVKGSSGHHPKGRGVDSLFPPFIVTPGHFQAQNPAPNGNAALYTHNFPRYPGFRVE